MKTIIALIAAAISINASADGFDAPSVPGGHNRVVRSVFINDRWAQISLDIRPALSCNSDALFVDLSMPYGAPLYATLLAARVSGQSLALINYERDAAGNCFVKYVSY